MNKLRYYKKVLFFFLPERFKERAKNRGLQNTLTLYKKIAKENKISKEKILEVFDDMQISSDILLHTSEMNIGKFMFPKSELVNIISDKVNLQKHSLIVAGLSVSGSMYEYIVRKRNHTFDVNNSPITTGVINELFAKDERAIRSLHPTHSAIVIGPDAIFYTKDHDLDDTPFGEHSPWWKIIKREGTLLMFGAPKNFTSIHAVEDAIGKVYPWKVYLKRKYAFDVIDQNGKHRTVFTRCHNPLTTLRRNDTLMDEFIDDMKARDYWKSYPIGASEIALVDAKGLALTYLDWVDKGKSIYGTHKVSKKLHLRIEQLKSALLPNRG